MGQLTGQKLVSACPLMTVFKLLIKKKKKSYDCSTFNAESIWGGGNGASRLSLKVLLVAELVDSCQVLHLDLPRKKMIRSTFCWKRKKLPCLLAPPSQRKIHAQYGYIAHTHTRRLRSKAEARDFPQRITQGYVDT